MIEWLTVIQDASNHAEDMNSQLKALVEQRNIAKELSDLVVYCVTVPFNEESKSSIPSLRGDDTLYIYTRFFLIGANFQFLEIFLPKQLILFY